MTLYCIVVTKIRFYLVPHVIKSSIVQILLVCHVNCSFPLDIDLNHMSHLERNKMNYHMISQVEFVDITGVTTDVPDINPFAAHNLNPSVSCQ